MKVFWLFLLIGVFQGINSIKENLKWVRVNVPQYRVPGETALLQCEYNLGNDKLYSVKWYKDHEEFYRFVPKFKPQTTSYKVEGVHVDMYKSDSKKVVLHSVNWKTSGTYKCEVSAEAPSFASAQSEAKMEVVTLPHEDPVIKGVKDQYSIGDEIVLNCTSGRSRPASILHWYINEQQIQKPEALIQYPIEIHPKGLVTSTLGLKFHLSNRHFLGGSMRVKCVASILPTLFGDERESDVQSLPIMRDMREALLLVRSSSSHHTDPMVYILLLGIIFSSVFSTYMK
ncbi:cell adhesion molecule 1-like [Anthonomus grandis grandis]|uniref:cell adhesion molecule 1-like n=1 Tax=Anthonomus grandis grandis TaxID=2921223 RepID=UPI0021657001|nr:cell adhesion molecule 1-like [Anthonomus grandis grandis]